MAGIAHTKIVEQAQEQVKPVGRKRSVSGGQISAKEFAGMLRKARKFAYKHSSISYLLSEDRENDPACRVFDRISLGFAFPKAQIFCSIMDSYQGSPVGIEFAAKDNARFAFVVPDNSGNGRYRVQMFDKNGFSSHSTESSMVDAVEEMVNSGFRVEAKGKLAELQATRDFHAGNETSTLLVRLNCGEISHDTFISMREALYAEN